MLVGLVLVMFLGITVYLLLCTIDYSIFSDEGDLLKRQFDLASRETMDESAEWRLKYDEEAEKATKCMNKLKQKKGSFGEGDGNAATINQKSLETRVDMRDFINAPNGLSKQSRDVNERVETDHTQSPLGGRTDVFDLPFHMARDQIEENLRNKMASIKERMVQLQDAQKEAEVTSEVTERELELEAQLVEARSIIQEQASIMSKQLAKSERPRNLNGGHLNSGRDSNISSPAEKPETIM
ncbi:unnamed protein product [Malus baccata var. baccata]